MPIYEYECTECGNVEEAFQKFSDKPLSTCNRCSGRLRKLISTSSFHLKGTGWYVTDYANKSRSNSPSKTTESSASSEAKKPSSEKASSE